MSSLQYLLRGFQLIFQPGIRFFALTPLAINLMLYALLINWLYTEFSVAVDWALAQIPSWLSFLVPLAWLLFGLAILILFGYSFALVAAIIASPFNGILAEKVAESTGKRRYDTAMNAQALWTLTRRSLWREVIKMGYFLPRIIGLLILGFILGLIPVIGFIASLIVFLWAAWSMCIQYVDYPADNDGIDFKNTLEKMKAQRAQSMVFGGLVTALLGLPLVNLLVMPAAVAGATLFWLEQLSERQA